MSPRALPRTLLKSTLSTEFIWLVAILSGNNGKSLGPIVPVISVAESDSIMKLASVEFENRRFIAVSDDPNHWRLLIPHGTKQWLRSASATIRNWETLIAGKFADQGFVVETGQLTFHCPLHTVEKVICVGKNYVEHAREMGGEAPDLPVIFSKFASSIIGPNDNIVLPPISQQVDFEAELVVVIGKSGRFIAREQAMQHVFGYTIGNDVSARDWQKGKPGGQWLLGKTFDTFAPIGPWIVTADEMANPQNLDIALRLNGQIMQQGNTRDLIFPIDYLIAHLSNFFTLQPGDLVFTGTPSGVGAGRQPPLFLQSGDSIEISISGIGTLANGVVASRSASNLGTD